MKDGRCGPGAIIRMTTARTRPAPYQRPRRGHLAHPRLLGPLHLVQPHSVVESLHHVLAPVAVRERFPRKQVADRRRALRSPLDSALTYSGCCRFPHLPDGAQNSRMQEYVNLCPGTLRHSFCIVPVADRGKPLVRKGGRGVVLGRAAFLWGSISVGSRPCHTQPATSRHQLAPC